MTSSVFKCLELKGFRACICACLLISTCLAQGGEAFRENYFLSEENPAATTDQRDLERLALAVSETDIYRQGREQAETMWRTAAGNDFSPQDWALFEVAMDEYAFNYALKAVNSDPNYPRVMSGIYAPARTWLGHSLPGSRLGGDGPDNHYAFIPLEDTATYKITGRRFSPAPATTIWQFSTNVMFTHSPKTVFLDEFEIDQDGRYSITLGPEPSEGKQNYITLPKDVKYMFVRESRSDWNQKPSALQVQRMDPPQAPPLTLKQMAERARIFMVNDVPNAYWFVRIARAIPANTMTAPFSTGSILGLHLQQISLGNLHLEDDEAYVVTVGSGEARFRDFVLQDVWYRTIDYPSRLSSMNNSQGVPNKDGSTTYVIAHQDPGVHNWLDTGGLNNLSPVHRWQGLPSIAAAEQPAFIDGKVVKFSELLRLLPAEMKRVTAKERARQLENRRKNYALRWIDR
jgi:Protein of unknown function (DUF1214)